MMALLFDYFETLVTRPLGGLGHGERMGCPGAYAAVWREWRRRRMTQPVAYVDLLREACRVAGIAANESIIETLARERAKVQEELLLTPEQAVLEMLAECGRKGWRTGVVSNCACEDVERWDAGPLGSLVDVPVFSCQVGAMKPEPSIYATAIYRMGVRPSDMAFVSDAISDIRGARSGGIQRGVWATWFLDRRAGDVVSCDLAGDVPEDNMVRVSDPRELVPTVEKLA